VESKEIVQKNKQKNKTNKKKTQNKGARKERPFKVSIPFGFKIITRESYWFD